MFVIHDLVITDLCDSVNPQISVNFSAQWITGLESEDLHRPPQICPSWRRLRSAVHTLLTSDRDMLARPGELHRVDVRRRDRLKQPSPGTPFASCDATVW